MVQVRILAAERQVGSVRVSVTAGVTAVVDSRQFRYRRDKDEEPQANPMQKAAAPTNKRAVQGGGL